MARLVSSICLCVVLLTSACTERGPGTFNGTIILHGPWPYDLQGIAFDAKASGPHEVVDRSVYQKILWVGSEIDSLKTLFDNSVDETVELSFTWTLNSGYYEISLWTWGYSDSTDASDFIDVLVSREFIRVEYQKISEKLIYDGPIFRP